MTPAAFAVLVASCGIDLPPGITADRLSDIAQVESGRNPGAVSPPNRDGSRDHGLMQVNERWFDRFGVTAAQAVEPCTNLQMGVLILADADRRAACIYNTGKPSCRNGYPERVQAAAAARERAPRSAVALASLPPPRPRPAGTAFQRANPAPPGRGAPAAPPAVVEAPAGEASATRLAEGRP